MSFGVCMMRNAGLSHRRTKAPARFMADPPESAPDSSACNASVRNLSSPAPRVIGQAPAEETTFKGFSGQIDILAAGLRANPHGGAARKRLGGRQWTTRAKQCHRRTAPVSGNRLQHRPSASQRIEHPPSSRFSGFKAILPATDKPARRTKPMPRRPDRRARQGPYIEFGRRRLHRRAGAPQAGGGQRGSRSCRRRDRPSRRADQDKRSGGKAFARGVSNYPVLGAAAYAGDGR